jgi:hypothetical protein
VGRLQVSVCARRLVAVVLISKPVAGMCAGGADGWRWVVVVVVVVVVGGGGVIAVVVGLRDLMQHKRRHVQDTVGEEWQWQWLRRRTWLASRPLTHCGTHARTLTHQTRRLDERCHLPHQCVSTTAIVDRTPVQVAPVAPHAISVVPAHPRREPHA